MKKLKIILNSKYTLIALIIIATMNTIYNISINKKSKIDLNEQQFESEIIDYKLTSKKLSITLKNKEKLEAIYYIGNNEEYNYIKDNIKYGIKIETIGNLSIPENNTIPYNFNYKKYLNNHGIYYIQKIDKLTIIDTNTSIINTLKNIIHSYLDKIDKTGYIKAFIISDKNNIDIYNSYQKIGISHLFAISGMHIILLSKIIYSIIKNKYKKLIYIIIVIIYTTILSFPISLTRCLIYIIIDYLSSKLNINISNIKKLIYTLLFIIIINYQSIYEISLYYSFIIVYGIFISDRFIKSSNKLISSFKLSLITFLFSAPLSLYFYYQLNILSIIYNLFYIPLISFIIYPLVLISTLFPFISPLLEIIIKITELITTYLCNINILTIHIGLNIYEVIIYYIILLILIIRKKYIMLFIPLIIVLIKCYIPYLDSTSAILYFDVSQGDSSLIITQYRERIILIDTGGIQNYNVSNNIITYLYHEGINHISTLIITHGDYDHMGEAVNLVENFKVEKVIFNCGEFDELENNLIKVLNKKKIPYYSCIKELNIGNNKLYFLQTKAYDNENDNSNVIYTKIDGYKFMFMGDAGIDKEKDILDKYNISDVDVLKVGHHGSKTSSSEKFIEEMNPKYSIISVGKNNRYGHPNKGVLNNLEKSKIYRTDEDGSIMFKINNKLKIETYEP